MKLRGCLEFILLIFLLIMNSTNVNTSSISEASGVGNNGLNWFQAQEVAWNNFHYISISYVSPTIAVIAVIENLAILSVLCRLKTGIAESARVYYALIASFNILNQVFLNLINAWSTMGLQFATQYGFYFNGVNTSVVVCKIVKSVPVFFSILVNWTYVLFNVDRMFAIAFPLRAKAAFNVRRNLLYVGIVALVGLIVNGYYAYMMQIASSPILMGPLFCAASTSSLPATIVYQVLSNGLNFTVPPAISLLLGLTLLICIRHQQKAREQLMSGARRSANAPSSSAIAGAAVVATMALVHATILLPAGIFGCFYFVYALYLFCLYLSFCSLGISIYHYCITY